MITLIISHSIYLSKQERYDLALEKKPIDIIGVSLPVWFKKGSTSEPAEEIFCHYRLTNQNPDYAIKSLNDGYQINIPNIPGENLSAKNLLDIKDDGCAWLAFKQYNKVRRDRRNYAVLHCVEIKPIETLNETLSS